MRDTGRGAEGPRGDIHEVAAIVRPLEGPLEDAAAARRIAAVRRWLRRRGVQPCGSRLTVTDRATDRAVQVWDLGAVRAELAAPRPCGWGALSPERRAAAARKVVAARGRPKG